MWGGRGSPSTGLNKETDLTLRTFLGARGMKKGDLSKFIEEAGRLVNQIRKLVLGVVPLPPRKTLPRPHR
ncbi:MAG TPA: ribbon-helix-helix domain-containing protein [Terriglobia bacterium]|nr:ribbon-helix-helix domain-containing protein [Terriglobia bacterium]